MKRFLMLMMMLFVLGPMQSGATSSAPPPEVSIVVSSGPEGMGGRTYSVQRGTAAEFSATFKAGGYIPKLDVYFGVLQPGNTNAHTWKVQSDLGVLTKGMHPIIEDLDLSGAPELRYVNYSAGKFFPLKHTFSDAEPAGMYTVFLLIVRANTNPGDPNNWFGIESLPVFVQ